MNKRAYLESIHLKPGGRYDIRTESVTIGRSTDCDIVLNVAQISRNHARITFSENAFFLQDLNSVNGTFVEEARIKTHRLRDGDKFSLGDIALTFKEDLTSRVQLTDDFGTDVNMTISVPIQDLASLAADKPDQHRRDPAEMIQIIFDAAKKLLGFSDIDEVLSAVMDLVFEFLKPDRGFLMLQNPSTGELEPRIVKCQGNSKEAINFSRTIVKKVFEEGVSILTTDAAKDQRFDSKDSIVMHQIHSCMCVPLWDEKKIIGIMYVDCRFARNYFQQRDLDLISTIAIISAIAIEQSRLNQEITREKGIREHLERYHSPFIINRIIDFNKTGVLHTEEKEITVLFADLVGFTTLSERIPPKEVATILNHFFNFMTDVIFNHEGTLDKFIGDSVMAVFGAPFHQDDHAIKAVKASVDMFQTLEKINASDDLPIKLEMRIGINSGKAVAGDIGSIKRLEYTVLGSTVNIASRIESSVAKTGEIVMGAYTKQLIGDLYPTTHLGEIPLRGLSSPLNLFRVDFKENREDTKP